MPIPVIVCLISACFLLVVSLPALLQKKLHFGVVFPTAVSCLLFLYAALACILPDSRPLRICGVFLTGCIVFGAVTALICSLFMCFGWRRFSALRVKGDETVLVLGCRVYPDHLSKMLVGRLQAAYTLLCRYPGMQCVVSGGKGEDEPCSEAAAMKRDQRGRIFPQHNAEFFLQRSADPAAQPIGPYHYRNGLFPSIPLRPARSRRGPDLLWRRKLPRVFSSSGLLAA